MFLLTPISPTEFKAIPVLRYNASIRRRVPSITGHFDTNVAHHVSGVPSWIKGLFSRTENDDDKSDLTKCIKGIYNLLTRSKRTIHLDVGDLFTIRLYIRSRRSKGIMYNVLAPFANICHCADEVTCKEKAIKTVIPCRYNSASCVCREHGFKSSSCRCEIHYPPLEKKMAITL